MPMTTIARSVIVGALIGDGAFSLYNESNARLGVGNSTTAFNIAQTDLQGASKFRQLVSSVQRASALLTFVATFGTAVANFAWEEWAVFNHPSAGQMLNRKIQNFGTKTSAEQWTLTVTLEPVFA